jgi:nitrate reductase NapE component
LSIQVTSREFGAAVFAAIGVYLVLSSISNLLISVSFSNLMWRSLHPPLHFVQEVVLPPLIAAVPVVAGALLVLLRRQISSNLFPAENVAPVTSNRAYPVEYFAFLAVGLFLVVLALSVIGAVGLIVAIDSDISISSLSSSNRFVGACLSLPLGIGCLIYARKAL